MTKAVTVIYRIHETYLILKSSKRWFSKQTEIVLTFMEALHFSGPMLASYLHIFP